MLSAIMTTRGEYEMLTLPPHPTETVVTETVAAVRQALARGRVWIALVVPPRSDRHLKVMALLVLCDRLVREAGGTLAVVGGDDETMRTLHELNLDSGMRFLEAAEFLQAG